MNQAKLTEEIDAAYEALYEDRADDARQSLQRAKKIDATSPEVRLLEIDLLDAEGEAEEAVGLAEAALQERPKSMVLALKYATLLLDTYDAVAMARPVLEGLWTRIEGGETPDVGDGEEREDFIIEVLLTLSDVRAGDHDPKGALQAAQAAVDRGPDDAMTRVALAAALFDLCRLDDAEKEVAKAIERDPRGADAYWLRGRVLTYRGDEAGADKAFARAVALDDERFQPPFRVNEAQLMTLLEESFEELPPVVRAYLKNVAITIEDVPEMERLVASDPPLSPGSLGLYEGTPPSLAPGDDPWAHFPSRITLFRKNIEISCAGEDELRDLVSSTLLHEVGHYLGLDEEDLDARGLG